MCFVDLNIHVTESQIAQEDTKGVTKVEPELSTALCFMLIFFSLPRGKISRFRDKREVRFYFVQWKHLCFLLYINQFEQNFQEFC